MMSIWRLSFISFVFLLLEHAAFPAYAGKSARLRSPEAGVLCDRNICADVRGVSRALTEKYLGPKALARLPEREDFDSTEFTFANGVFCDVKERLCRTHRYYGKDGKRAGTPSRKYTKLLFNP